MYENTGHLGYHFVAFLIDAPSIWCQCLIVLVYEILPIKITPDNFGSGRAFGWFPWRLNKLATWLRQGDVTNGTFLAGSCSRLMGVLFTGRYTNLLHEPARNVPFVTSTLSTVYPKKYAHGFVVLCFVVVMQSFMLNSHEVFIHIHQGCFAGTGAIVRLPQCQWSKPDGYGKISQCITTTKQSTTKPCAYFLGYTVFAWNMPCVVSCAVMIKPYTSKVYPSKYWHICVIFLCNYIVSYKSINMIDSHR